ncbi:hypothetical protein ADL03_41530 [Nocardia sp. NRRL S-836]|nr:hypothetical protein ADL03_41530 [Nocardia sp. NRRL S-836]
MRALRRAGRAAPPRRRRPRRTAGRVWRPVRAARARPARQRPGWSPRGRVRSQNGTSWGHRQRGGSRGSGWRAEEAAGVSARRFKRPAWSYR